MGTSEFSKYIGGELEIDEEILAYSLNKNNDIEKNYTLYSCGRLALKKILQKIKPEHPVLLPSYLCESVIQPFRELNIKYKFYRIESDLSIDYDYLFAKLKTEKFSALLFIDYFGFIDQYLDFDKIKNLQSEIIIIEDVTHLTFIPQILQNYEYRGDVVFGSLRKIFPIPDGGFVFNDRPLNYSSKSQKIVFSEIKLYGKMLRAINIKNYRSQKLESIYLKLLELSEKILDDKIPDEMISNTAKNILLNIDFESVFKIRIENYNFLKNLFENDPTVRLSGQVLKKINLYDMPYMLPFYFQKYSRDFVRKKLIKRNIFTSIIWNLPEEIEEIEYSSAHELSNNLLCFPIDQRYDESDMIYIFDNLKEVLSYEIVKA